MTGSSFWGWWESLQRTRELKQQEVLFHRGDPVTIMYRLVRGRVRLERRTIEGHLLVLHTAKAGELIAEASLFADAYHCDGVASEPTVVSMCPRDLLSAELAADSAKALEFSRVIGGQLQAARLRLELKNVRSAADRTLVYLDLNTDATTGRLELRGPLQDIASEIGLTREAFYRALASLEKRGRIRRDAQSIVLLRRV